MSTRRILAMYTGIESHLIQLIMMDKIEGRRREKKIES